MAKGSSGWPANTSNRQAGGCRPPHVAPYSQPLRLAALAAPGAYTHTHLDRPKLLALGENEVHVLVVREHLAHQLAAVV